jgi:hypothetical protein
LANSVACGTPQKKKPPPPPLAVAAPTPEETAESKMKQSIREAEKKLVIFNLDYGSAPVMNKDTLARKVTLALNNKVKEGKHDYHIGDAEEVVDDILSCTRLEFLGTSTKQFFNKKNAADPRNKVMHTIPVRLEFKDRETRLQAEISLRKICKVNCAVPYPKPVRAQLDALIAEGKQLRPDCFIRTRVNAEKLTIDACASVNKKWVDLGLQKSILTVGSAAMEPDTGDMEVMVASQDLS